MGQHVHTTETGGLGRRIRVSAKPYVGPRVQFILRREIIPGGYAWVSRSRWAAEFYVTEDGIEPRNRFRWRSYHCYALGEG
jgi:hypothetical protein